MRKIHPYIYLPIAFALVLILGIYLGNHMVSSPGSGKAISKTQSGNFDRLVKVLNLIQQDYVDTIGTERVVNATVESILEELDPHSEFIPASRFKEVNDPLKGNFDGIGIEFRKVKDTIIVIRTIPGGPSEQAGLMPGDRIVKVNDTTVAGNDIPTDSIVSMLKGERNTKVDVAVYRRGNKGLLDFTITRGEIPTYSLDVSYMVNDQIGYVKLNKFSATTSDELHEAIQELKGQQMTKLILDLRGNGGGYLSESIEVADEFLRDGELIVYTEGKNRPVRKKHATGDGLFQEGELVVLIDEMSASASEIVAGAIQDNDRGTIIGRRSFGKGLVQEQMKLKDGSAIRLTVARYHTPSGRSIQKPYKPGDSKDYYMDFLRSMENDNKDPAKDSIVDSSKVYTTSDGDTVYGGGGIFPDIYVPREEGLANELTQKLIRAGIIFRFAFQYADDHRDDFKRFADAQEFVENFEVQTALMEQLKSFAGQNGIHGEEKEYEEAKRLIKSRLKAFIGRNFFDDEAFYPVIHKVDIEFQKALDYLKE
ncbi:MAG: S41 family peptidase [Bacteroidota bacterium]